MLGKFTCQVVTASAGNMRKVHFVRDDGVDRGDIFINAPHEWFSEAVHEQAEYLVNLIYLSPRT